MLSDFFRFLALYIYGGYYIDLDNQPFLPIEKWTGYPFNKIILNPEAYDTWDLGDMTLLFAPPKHPFMLHCLRTIH